MNSNKVLMGIALFAVAGAANATIVLTNVSGGLGAQFSSLIFAPTYNDTLGTANVTINAPHSVTMGTVNSWLFTAVDTANIGKLQYDITLDHILPKGKIEIAQLTAYHYNPLTGKIGTQIGTGLTVFNTNIDAYTGLSTSTQTLDFGYDISSFHTKDAEYKLNMTVATPEPAPFAAMGLGVAGLMIRRRRSAK
jgi:hypothetical protein